jgi:hypothetical protein
MRRVLCIAAAAWATSACDAARAQEFGPARPKLEVHIDFPGGSAEVVQIDQDGRIVRLRPSAHPGRGWRCWWYFRLSGIRPGETITWEVEGDQWAWPQRAAVALDDAKWAHSDPGQRLARRPGEKADAMVYRCQVAARQAWLAWGPPYLPRHAEAMIAAAEAACPHARGFQLCRTREARPVPALRVAHVAGGGRKRLGVWVQARQHAWESGSSWACHGFAEWLTSADPRARALRAAADVTIVPIMDVDNVVRGAGGKAQTPCDHNRDWCDQPHWPSVAAAIREIGTLAAAGRFDVFVDLHNPGANDREPFFYVPPAQELSDLQERNLRCFLAAAKAEMAGPLKFTGKTKVSGPAYDKNYKKISKNWVATHTAEHVVAVTLEIAWNTPGSTQANYRRVGRELGLAIERYLREERPARSVGAKGGAVPASAR